MSYVTRDGEVVDGAIATLPDAEVLFARRRELVAEVAPLRALYGGAGYFGERVFKLDEAKVETAVRSTMLAGKKEGERAPTEGAIDAVLRQQPDYISALTKQIERRALWIKIEEELAEIDWRLRLRTSDSYLLAAEMKLS